MDLPLPTVDPVLLVLVVWLTQVLREALRIPSRFIAPTAAAVALALAALPFVPDQAIRDAILAGLSLAAVANTSVRFVKHAPEAKPPRDRWLDAG